MTNWKSVHDKSIKKPEGGWLSLSIEGPKGRYVEKGSIDSDENFLREDGYRYSIFKDTKVTHWDFWPEPCSILEEMVDKSRDALARNLGWKCD